MRQKNESLFLRGRLLRNWRTDFGTVIAFSETGLLKLTIVSVNHNSGTGQDNKLQLTEVQAITFKFCLKPHEKRRDGGASYKKLTAFVHVVSNHGLA